MMKTYTAMTALALFAIAPPLLADHPSGSMLMRDSDGIVISVTHPFDYYIPRTGIGTNGGIVYTMGGHVLQFASGPGGLVTDLSNADGSIVVGPTAMVDGTSYKVEVSGTDIWLREPATGIRHATERRTAIGQTTLDLLVNPNGFAIE